MANPAPALITTARDFDKRTKENYNISFYQLQFDDSSDVTLLGATADKRNVLVSIFGSPSVASVLNIKLGVKTLPLNYTANEMINFRLGKVLFVSNPNEALIMNMMAGSPQYLWVGVTQMFTDHMIPDFGA